MHGEILPAQCSRPLLLLNTMCRYENLVQVRCLLDGTTEDDMLQHWHTLLPDRMARWQLDRSEV